MHLLGLQNAAVRIQDSQFVVERCQLRFEPLVLLFDTNQLCALLTKDLFANVGKRQQFLHILWFWRLGAVAAHALE